MVILKNFIKDSDLIYWEISISLGFEYTPKFVECSYLQIVEPEWSQFNNIENHALAFENISVNRNNPSSPFFP